VPGARRPTAGTFDPQPPALRLAIGREGIGLELERPVMLPGLCLRVSTVATVFRNTRFPVDVSGGVSRFRHRRGELARLEMELPLREFETWAAPRLRGIVGDGSPWVTASVHEATLVIGIAHPAAPDDAPIEGTRRGLAIVAFDVDAVADEDDLLLVVHSARGDDLPRPPTAIAMACARALLGPSAVREGAVFRVRRIAAQIVRRLLPEAGARAPATHGVRCTVLAALGDTAIVALAPGAAASPPSPAAARALDAAVRLRDADDALFAGRDDDARAAAMAELARAPRDPEALRRVVEIDATVRGRAEAALAAIAELPSDFAERLGPAPGELRAEVGDVAGAMAALARIAEREPCAPLAARAGERAAALAGPDAWSAVAMLDRALARWPASATARWARAAARVSLGRVDDALADIEHLDAGVRTSRAKHAVWMRAGALFQRGGLAPRAGAIFERALLFAPDEPAALAGLGAALVSDPVPTALATAAHDAAGRRVARGVRLLARAADRAYADGAPLSVTAGIELALARAFAERLDDLPAAIAHVSRIPSAAAESATARLFEARWRARLGDRAGARLAYAQVREHAASVALPTGAHERERGAVNAAPLVEALVEAARFEREAFGDLLGAQRHLSVALRVSPHDRDAALAFRAVGEAIAGLAPEAHRTPPPAPSTPDVDAADTLGTFGTLGEADDDAKAARAEELTRRLHGDPTNDAVADELARLLEALGRHHELLALLSARLEDASAERRADLAPRVRTTLERLARAAEEAGHLDEAALYRSFALAGETGTGAGMGEQRR
jgi:tetratricopeptide (TPR) repeat protein